MTITAPEFTDLTDPLPGVDAPPASGGNFAAGPARKPPMPDPDPVKAPNGWIYADGEWRGKKLRGRPKARTEPPAQAPTAPEPKRAPEVIKPKEDYRQTIGEVVEALWLATAGTPIPPKAFGKDLDAIRVRMRVSAALLQQNVNELATGINNMGEHVPFVERALGRLRKGDGGLWVLPTAMMLAPFIAQIGMTWSTPVDADATAIAETVEQQAREYFEKAKAAAAVIAAQQVDDTAS